MMPIGPLMIEHRLIERMIAVLADRLAELDQGGSIDPRFVDTAVDFIRSYADRCHHGKEEDILFRELRRKPLAPEHRRVMEELEAEHAEGRRTVAALVEANRRLRAGDRGALADIAAALRWLVEFYPAHIDKEDKRFFLPAMEYFDAGERERMLAEGYEFDRQLIHERYRRLVEQAEAPSSSDPRCRGF